MPFPAAIEPSVGSPSEIVRDPPRWGFWKGLLVGITLEIPAISAAVFLLPRLGLGHAAPAMLVVRMTSLFAGLPALLTSGGIGRLAAYESVKRRRREAIARVAGVHALAGVMLTFIAALPHGYLPSTGLGWAAMVLVGAAAGALCGAAIGVMCTGAPPRQVTEMISLVKRPGVTLRQLIDSEDLGRIGAAVRHRASQMFDGLLDPAAPRPEGAAPHVAISEENPEVARGTDDATGAPPGAEERAAGEPRA
jgi:hypothetical protein